MKKITYLEIENIRGISKKSFDLSLYPNTTSIFVAPNGFGKSSIAIAFKSLNKNRINLDQDDYHQTNTHNLPKITLKYEDENGSTHDLIADRQSNQISSKFGIFVINNPSIPKAKKMTFGGKTIVTASNVVNPIVICKIPEKINFNYSPKVIKAAFGVNGKLLGDLGVYLKDRKLIAELNAKVDFTKFLLKGNQSKLNLFISQINSIPGSTTQIIQSITSAQTANLDLITNFTALQNILKSFYKTLSPLESYLISVQFLLLFLKDPKAFQKSVQYCIYCMKRDSYKKIIAAFAATWKNISAKEIQDELQIVFPDIKHISNGERDSLTFVAQLLNASEQLDKEFNLLIIDEVFDYLDDANLIACQYFITEFIEQFKNSKRQIYPILMTHLNPYYFQNYYFKSKNVFNLEKAVAKPNSSLRKIIENREHTLIKDDFSKYFLHYNPFTKDLKAQFSTLVLDVNVANSADYKAFVFNELAKYVSGNGGYCPLAVCCAVRLKVEENIYQKIASNAGQQSFLFAHSTNRKLEVAEQASVEVPEIYYLLGIIYNDGLHLTQGTDKITPIALKLRNSVIRHLISSI